MMTTGLPLDRRFGEAVEEIDKRLICVILTLLAIGVVMVYSATIATAEGRKISNFQSTYYLFRHLAHLCVGMVCALLAFRVPIERWQRWALPLFLLGLLLLIMVLTPWFGKKVNGAQRWLVIGPLSMQPSEFMKLFALLYAADYAIRKQATMANIKRAFLPMLIAMSIVGLCLLRQPDFGTLVVIIVISFGILFFGGLPMRLFVVLFVLVMLALALMIYFEPYRRQRLIAFTDPWNDPFDKGYQLSHALIAFGRGGFLGAGLGASVEKLYYLPEAHTDFLFAVIAEELGFVGVMAVIVLFAWFVHRVFTVAQEAVAQKKHYAALVAMGIGLWFGVQGLINIGVNMGVLPTKGITLPLLSHGGSAIITNCIALAILIRIDWELRLARRGEALP